MNMNSKWAAHQDLVQTNTISAENTKPEVKPKSQAKVEKTEVIDVVDTKETITSKASTAKKDNN